MAYVKFQLEDGTFVYIESADTPKGNSGLIPSKGPDHAEPATETFNNAVDSISKMASALMGNLRSGFTEDPAEISISFGIKASADLGNLFVARGGMESNYNVSVRWHKEKDTDTSESDADEKAESKKDEKKTKASA